MATIFLVTVLLQGNHAFFWARPEQHKANRNALFCSEELSAGGRKLMEITKGNLSVGLAHSLGEPTDEHLSNEGEIAMVILKDAVIPQCRWRYNKLLPLQKMRRLGASLLHLVLK